VAGEFAFPASARLLKPSEFRRVFELGQVRHTRLFSLRFVPLPDQDAAARLGLAVSRKACPLAVERNRIKRTVRESFRRQRTQLPAMDIVVMAKPAARNEPELAAAADRLWQQLSDHGMQTKD
jgi:ribonuclease P protein component